MPGQELTLIDRLWRSNFTVFNLLNWSLTLTIHLLLFLNSKVRELFLKAWMITNDFHHIENFLGGGGVGETIQLFKRKEYWLFFFGCQISKIYKFRGWKIIFNHIYFFLVLNSLHVISSINKMNGLEREFGTREAKNERKVVN